MADPRLILGTAGHIDHGKTALVRSLTGIDTDRLQQEKQRGISIDVGFAHLDLAGDSAGDPLDRARYETFAKFLVAQGVIAHSPPVADYAVELR